jgi:MFS family permease
MKLKNMHYGWIVAFTAGLILMVYSVSIYSRGIFLTSLTEWFNWSRGDISGAYSLSMITAGLLASFSGRLTDRFGPRVVITLLGLLAGGGLLLMSTVGSIVHVYLVWILIIGVGGSCSFTPITSTLPKWFKERRGLAIGITFAGVSLGGIIWPPIVERLIANIGWRSTYVVCGIITLVIIVLLAQLMKQDPQKIGIRPYGEKEEAEPEPEWQRIGQRTTGLSFSRALRTAPYWLMGLTRFCSMFVFQLISVHIFPHAVDIGFSEMTAAIIISIFSVSGTVSRLLAGFIADMIGHRLTLLLSAVILALSLVILLFANELWHLFTFALLFGLAWGGVGVTQVTLIAEFFGLRSLGTIIGSLELFLTTGGAIGVSIAGIIFDNTLSYTISFIICVAQALLVMLFSFLLIRYKHTGVVY